MVQCPYCGSYRTEIHAKTRKGFLRYKCLVGCGTFSERTGTFFFRHRFPKWVIMLAVLLCLFMRSEHVRLVLYIVFGVKVSKRSVLSWTKKYLSRLSNVYLPVKGVCEDMLLVVHADEKFFKINGAWAYWWSLVDNYGSLVACVVTQTRDLTSAKKLFKDAKLVLGKVDLVVTDGLKSYVKAKNVFGRKTKHVVTGFKGRIVNYASNKLTFVDNNVVESLNSEIDVFLSRFRYSFSSLESAERWMKCFMLCRNLLRKFKQINCSGITSQPVNRTQKLSEEPLIPFQKAVY